MIGAAARAAAGALLLAVAGWACGADAPPAGEALYRRGLLSDGGTLTGQRAGGGSLQGAAAACVNCHQRSGFGSREGRVVVPPITGRYLLRETGKTASEGADLPFLDGMRGDRPPYTDTSLARAIREGIDAQGRPLAAVMPRYTLSDTEMASLIAYLKGLDRNKVPGVTATSLQFATVVTPDADPVKRSAMLEVMRRFFDDRNARQMAPVPAMRTSGKTAYARSMFMVHRKWELRVWELSGEPSTWRAQLEQHLKEEPVFALLSGLGGRDWAPVQAFCERAELPCIFPNVEAPPPDADRDFYSMYYSRGVLLEADLAAHALMDNTGPAAAGARRLVQVYREGDVGEAAARALEVALEGSKLERVRRVIPRQGAAAAVPAALADAPAGTLALWLRPADLAALPPAPSGAGDVFVSGQMAGLERAPLPPAWRTTARLLYPYDLPDKRRVRVDYALGWMAARRIPRASEQVQVDTYLACGLVSETLMHMTDAFVRDYLVERLQNTLDHRLITGYYPRLSLAPGQRFASKGGRLVRLDAQTSVPKVIAEGDWVVP